jgi:hypothetical protein
MGTLKKDILIGFLVSMIATVAGGFVYLEHVSKVDFYETIDLIHEGKLYGKVLSIAAIPNLFVFFVYIKKQQDRKARGVLLGTILIAFTTLFLKFL